MKIGVIGEDARTAAIVKAISKEKNQIFAAGAKINPQIARLAQWNIAHTNPKRIIELLKAWEAEVVIIGPEKPLAQGIVDILEKAGIAVAAPSSVAAQIELDKAWMVELLKKYGMEKWLPESKIFRGTHNIRSVSALIELWNHVAVKPSGLTGGKGVKVTGVQLVDKEAAKNYAAKLLLNGQTVVVQKKISGREFTVQTLVDKYGFMVFTPPIVDYKLLYDGAVILNPYTGSMGCVNYANGRLPFASNATIKEAHTVMKKTVVAIEEETSEPFKGILYGQFMLTDDGKLVLIEFNARLGDPEGIRTISLLSEKNDFAEICQRIANGTLSEVKIEFGKYPGLVKYVVPLGYGFEQNPQQVIIETINSDPRVKMYCGGVVETDEGYLVTTGGRAIAIEAEDITLRRAADIVNDAIPKIFANNITQLHWRPGIGIEA